MARRDTVLVSKTLYQIGLVTLITAIAWVGIGIYLATTREVNVNVEKDQLEPILTNIDQEVVKSLSNRLKPGENLVPPSATIDDVGVKQ